MRRIAVILVFLIILPTSCGKRADVPEISDKPAVTAEVSPSASPAPSLTAAPGTPKPEPRIPAETPAPSPEIPLLQKDGESGRMNDDLALFCGSNRLAGTPGEIAALEYAEETMKSLGLETSRQNVSHGGERIFESFNVIGIKRSSAENAPIVILCSHADNAAKGTGATDDAAGLAVMLEAARQTAVIPDDAAEVRYIAFTSEEYALLGSETYVASLSKQEKSRVVGVLNLDMFASENASGVYAYFENNEVGLDFWNRLIEAAKNAGTEIYITRTHEIGSDSISFEKAGMPAVLLTHSVVEDEYHKKADSADKVDEAKLKYALDLSVAWIGSELTTN
jgi:hypothetical protein